MAVVGTGSRVKQEWPSLGECRANKPCLDVNISIELEENLAMGIVRSDRKVARWGKQMEDAAAKGNKTQVDDLRSLIWEERKHIEDLSRIAELVADGTCNGSDPHKPARFAVADAQSARAIALKQNVQTLPEENVKPMSASKHKGVSKETVKKVAAETAAHAAQKELEGITPMPVRKIKKVAT
jgi:hypothetical protein